MKLGWWSAVLGIALATIVLPSRSSAQDQEQDDPPSRVARLGYLQGSVSFQPAGETEWVGAVPNRPMSSGDQLWTDQDSRAEVQLGSATIRLASNTGFSFLSLDDNTVQIQLTSGEINVSVRRLAENDVFEVDTPNQAFTIFKPGRYRVAVNADGNTVVNVRIGEGESTGGGQSYDLISGQRATLSGTDTLYADVGPMPGFDEFDRWSEDRDHHYDSSRSAQYLSHDVVGYDDLDDHGDWRDDSNYGHVWFPQVAVGWAPYHDGHWSWISPWGWTWVDDAPWGYAPFHYGRWVTVGGRWGWVAGPVAVRAVYAPALVVFIGGGPGGFGGNVGWFPLGPREVYVPSYHVSQAYVNRVNVSNTTVNVTQVTNVYNTTIINKTTNITNITYANRNVQGAVMVVPQHAFTSAQPVAKASVAVSAREIAAAPMNARVAVAPTRESVFGGKAATAGRVAAPPAAVANRQVVAKKTPPPPPVPFAKQQQALAAHPGQPLARTEVQTLRPAVSAAAAHPMVKVAPPAKPATPNVPHTAPPPIAARPNQPAAPAPANQPANRPANQPAANERPAAPAPPQPSRPAPQPTPAQPTRQPAPSEPARPAPNREPVMPPSRPEATKPAEPPARPPAAPPTPSRPEANRPPVTPPNRPAPAKPAEPPARNERPPAAQPTPNRPEANRPPVTPPSRPETTKPAEPPARNERPPVAQPNRPEPARPEASRPAPAPRPQTPPPAARPEQRTPPPAAKPAAPPKKEPAPKTPEQKKKEEEKKGG